MTTTPVDKIVEHIHKAKSGTKENDVGMKFKNHYITKSTSHITLLLRTTGAGAMQTSGHLEQPRDIAV